MVKTTLINIHEAETKNFVYIGRGSSFGNKYVIGEDGTREEVIEKYKKWFYKRIDKQPRFLKDVLRLRGKTLGCFCKPDGGFKGRVLCHGQIIISYIEKIPPEEVM